MLRLQSSYRQANVSISSGWFDRAVQGLWDYARCPLWVEADVRRAPLSTKSGFERLPRLRRSQLDHFRKRSQRLGDCDAQRLRSPLVDY
jgi:hypothetical protein